MLPKSHRKSCLQNPNLLLQRRCSENNAGEKYIDFAKRHF